MSLMQTELPDQQTVSTCPRVNESKPIDEEKLILALATATKIEQNYKVALDGLGGVGPSAVGYYLTDFP